MLVHIKRYSIEEVENLLKETNLHWDGKVAHTDSIMLDGYKVYPHSMRYKNFFTHGYKCVTCGKEGTHFYLDVDPNQNNTRAHFNLYADDGTLITKDHILPKSYGGSNTDINNFQTMCTFCNNQKGNTIPPEIYDIGMFDLIPPTKKIKGKGKKQKIVEKHQVPKDNNGNIIHAKDVMKCNENDNIYIYYGNNKFNSIDEAIQYALNNISGKRATNETEYNYLYNRAKRKINSAIYQNRKFGSKKWTVKIENI